MASLETRVRNLETGTSLGGNNCPECGWDGTPIRCEVIWTCDGGPRLPRISSAVRVAGPYTSS